MTMAAISSGRPRRPSGACQRRFGASANSGSIIGPLVLTGPMAYFTGGGAPIYFPGAAFVVSAVFGIGALVLLRQLPRVQPV